MPNKTTISSAETRPSSSVLGLTNSLWRYHNLLGHLIVRDVESRYRGSLVGVLWALLLPCIMLMVYVFVFGYVFSPVKTAARHVTPDFALSLFTGMLLHGFIAECLARAPSSILAQPSYVKKVVFPIELLPFTVVGSALVQFMMGSSVLLMGLAMTQGLPITTLLWPLFCIPLILFAAGISLILSAFTVYLRDLAQLTGFVATMLLFLSPVFYTLESVAHDIRIWMLINPLTIPIEISRALLIQGRVPDIFPWGVHSLLCLIILAMGWWLFQRTRRGFSDVI